MRKFTFLYIILLAVFMMPIKVQAMDGLPTTVRVGLYHNSTSRNSYRLYSDEGFRIRLKIGENSYETIDIYDKSLEISTLDTSGLIFAKKGIKNKQDALEFISQFSGANNDKYLFFDGTWSVLEKAAQRGELLNNFGLVTIKGDSVNPPFIYNCTRENPVYISNFDANGLIAINGQRYRGELELIKLSDVAIQVVNQLGLEEYLYGVIPKEMSPSWHMEALKAQAVASRTYCMANISKWQNNGFDISASTGDQVYGGYDVENLITNNAVEMTKGQIIVYDNKPITAFYHADSGGVTEDCKDVFGSELPYLKPVNDIFSTGSPYSEWETVLSPEDLSDKLKAIGKFVGDIHEIEIIERGSSGRIKKIYIKGNQGETIIENSQIRDILQLKSNFFDIIGETRDNLNVVSNSESMIIKNIHLGAKNIVSEHGLARIKNDSIFILGAKKLECFKFDAVGDIFTIHGFGYGHGVGMSQWGAKAMAENGCNYTDILLHYYKNVEISVF